MMKSASVVLSTGLGHLSHAEEYLSQAQWTVLKTPECSHDIKSQLHRNVGLLYAAKGDYPESLNQLGNDVRTYPRELHDFLTNILLAFKVIVFVLFCRSNS